MSKKKNNKNNSIKCEVESCKYNDCEAGYCELDEIKVGCTCNNDECQSTTETVCESFEKDENKCSDEICEDDTTDDEERITDTEYEVEAEYDSESEEIDDNEKEDE